MDAHLFPHLCSDGLYQCDLYSYGLCTCGLHTYGLYSYGLCSHGPQVLLWLLLWPYMHTAYVCMAYIVVAYTNWTRASMSATSRRKITFTRVWLAWCTAPYMPMSITVRSSGPTTFVRPAALHLVLAVMNG